MKHTPYKRYPIQTAIYCIENIVNGKKYIGSTKTLSNRMRDHRWKLNSNIHPNPKLQASWNKHGEKNFILYPILFCLEKDLLYYEQKLINALSKRDYNICKIANGGPKLVGDKHPRATVTERQVHKLKELVSEGMRPIAAIKKLKINNNVGYAILHGTNWSHIRPDLNDRLNPGIPLGEDNYLAKLTKEDVIEIKKLLVAGIKLNDLALKYNVNRSTIGSIKYGKSWKWVK